MAHSPEPIDTATSVILRLAAHSRWYVRLPAYVVIVFLVLVLFFWGAGIIADNADKLGSLKERLEPTVRWLPSPPEDPWGKVIAAAAFVLLTLLGVWIARFERPKELHVWYTDTDGYFAGELDAYGRLRDSIETLAANAAKLGHRTIPKGPMPMLTRPPNRPRQGLPNGGGAAGRLEADVTPPSLVAFAITPRVVHETNVTDAYVEVEARLVDELSGVAGPGYSSSPTQVRFRSPSGRQFVDAVFVPPDKLISGDARDGRYRDRVVIRRYSELGSWRVEYVLLVDQVGNQARLSGQDLENAGFPMSFELSGGSRPGQD